MKKLFAIAVVAGMLSGLYGMTFGIGVAYDNLAGEEGTDPYLSIRADVTVKPMPILGFRMGLVTVDLPEGSTSYVFGTGVSADVLVYIPMVGMINPYIPVGFWYGGGSVDAADLSYSSLHLKGGVGAEFMFGTVGAYLEGGINFMNVSQTVGTVETSSSSNPFYVQGGIKIPVKL